MNDLIQPLQRRLPNVTFSSMSFEDFARYKSDPSLVPSHLAELFHYLVARERNQQDAQ